MSKLRYNKLSEVLAAHPLDTLTYEEIYYQHGTGVDESLYRKDKGGRNRLVEKRYRFGVQTPIGDIREAVWYDLAEKLIYKRCEGWLLDAMEEWYARSKNPRNLTQKEFREKVYQAALKSVVCRLHECEQWVHFIPFGREYHPKVLEGKTFLTIRPSCCGKPGLVSAGLISRDGSYCCPHCGRWSPAEILNRGSWEELASDLVQQ